MEPKYRVVMRTGPNVGMAYMLDKPEMSIGRDLTNEIVINDPEVSRRHARVLLQGQNYILEDLGSTNGTAVNGQRLAGPYLLQPGEVIILGEQVSMLFELVRPEFDATIGAPAPRPVPQPIEQPSQQPGYSPQGSYSPVDYPRQQPQQPVYPTQPPAYVHPQGPAASGYQQPAPVPYPQPYPPAPQHQHPVEYEDDEEETPKRKIPVWLIVLIIAFVVLLCVCGVIAYFMSEEMWCALFGWFFNAFYGAGTCP